MAKFPIGYDLGPFFSLEIWGVPKLGLPFKSSISMGLSLTKTIQLWGYPHDELETFRISLHARAFQSFPVTSSGVVRKWVPQKLHGLSLFVINSLFSDTPTYVSYVLYLKKAQRGMSDHRKKRPQLQASWQVFQRYEYG